MAIVPQSEWSRRTLEALHGGGYRNGLARRAVVELLGRQDCCLTAQEIFDELRAEDRQVGIASIYRVLDLLTEKGLLQRVDLGAGIARYEAVHSGGEHHHHLVCDHCGRPPAVATPVRSGPRPRVPPLRSASARRPAACPPAPCGRRQAPDLRSRAPTRPARARPTARLRSPRRAWPQATRPGRRPPA